MNSKRFIPISKPSITELEVSLIKDAADSGWVSSLGRYVDEFENMLCQFCDVEYSVSTSNGTHALHLALAALGIGEGDEVIVPDLTFISTANAVVYTGAKPVFVDIDEDTLALNIESTKNAVNPRTKAILAVHLYGHPAPMLEINEIAKDNELFVIEDCAEAHGAKINGRLVGGFSDVAIFSFYGNKIFTTGEGGALVTNNTQICQKARLLRDHGMSSERKYWHEEIGFNYRLTNLQAALGVAQLKRQEEILQKRNELAQLYRDYLGSSSLLRINRHEEWATPAFWISCVEFLGKNEVYRDEIIQKLKARGIDSRPYFYQLTKMPMFDSVENPVSERVSERGICLPTFYGLTHEDVEYICLNLLELCEK